MTCTHKSTCELFPLFSYGGSLTIWQTNYCDSKFERCVRFQKSLKKEFVPPTLLPNGKSLELQQDG